METTSVGLPASAAGIKPWKTGGALPGGAEFEGLLRKASGQISSKNVKFSSHALARLEHRKMDMNDHMMSRLDNGIGSLAAKGAKDGLVIAGDYRFLVSVTNKTVITAMHAMERDIYTDIDGVVFV